MHRLGPFAGLQPQPQSTVEDGFTIKAARICILEDSEGHAVAEQCLVPWMGNADNLMDRYDARILLEDLDRFETASVQCHARVADADAGVTAEELDAERYADLDPSKEHLLDSSKLSAFNGSDSDLAVSQPSPDRPSNVHQGPAFAFDYSTNRSQQAQAALTAKPRPLPPLLPVSRATDDGQEAQYRPPYASIPVYLEGQLPLSQRQHQIIAQTAKFVRSNGNQVEVLLRVKHGGNPNFSFLIISDRLFPYYRWLVEQAPEEVTVEQTSADSAQQAQVEDKQQRTDVMLEQQQQQQRQQQQQPASGVPPAVSAMPTAARDNAAGLGGLELLRAYSMNSEAGSDVWEGSQDPQEQQQEQEQPGSADDTALDKGDTEPLMYGPALPADVAAQTATTKSSFDITADGQSEQQSGLRGPGFPQRSPPPLAVQETEHPEHQAGSPHVGGHSDELVAPGTEQQQLLPAPPDQVKAIIDKLVAFVKKNGIKFERVVRAREENNPRFAFLHPGTQHHEYYRKQLEAALGFDNVRQLFDDMSQQQLASKGVAASGVAVALEQDAQPAVAVSTSTAATAVAAPRVLLKANPRLLVKRPLGPPAAAAAEGDASQRSVTPGPADVADDRGDSPSAPDEQQHTEAGSNPGKALASDEQAGAQHHQPQEQQVQQQEDAGNSFPDVANTGPTSVLAQKRLKLQMYLRQRRAEQLAEQQQQEHEAKARAILAHRLLLKRLASGADSDSSASDAAGADAANHDALHLHTTQQQQQQPQEIEEGEIPESPEPPDAGEAVPDTDAAVRAEAQKLLQGSPEPVDTTLPGLKELASSAAVAAAKHRAALMVDSDDEEQQQLQDDPAERQRQMIAAALRAAQNAAVAAGAGSVPGTAPVVSAAPAVVPIPAAGPVVNMAAAANAAAAVIAAQAAGVSAVLVQPQQPALQMSEPLILPALQPDATAALAAAAADAVIAAAAAANKQQDSRAVEEKEHSTSSSSRGRSRSSSRGHSRSSASSSSNDSSSDRGDSGEARPIKRRRSGSSRRQGTRNASPDQELSKSKSSTLRRGDSALRRDHRSRRHHKQHSKRSKSRHRHRHCKSSRRSNKRSRSPVSGRDRSRSSKHRRHEKHARSSRHRQKPHAEGTCSGDSNGQSSDEELIGTSSRQLAPELATIVPPQQAPASSSTAAASPPAAAVAAARAGPTAAAGPSLVDSDELRQRLRQMMGQIRR